MTARSAVTAYEACLRALVVPTADPIRVLVTGAVARVPRRASILYRGGDCAAAVLCDGGVCRTARLLAAHAIAVMSLAHEARTGQPASEIVCRFEREMRCARVEAAATLRGMCELTDAPSAGRVWPHAPRRTMPVSALGAH